MPWLSAWAGGGVSIAPRPNAETIALACGGCHGEADETGNTIPNIHGKDEAEFIWLMQEFKAGTRTASVMNRIAKGYTGEDIARLAHYFKSR
jgi:cytochrome c553